MIETILDRAHATGDRMAFFNALASAELFLLLAKEPEGDAIEPDVFHTEEGAFALAFDLEERLAAFVGGPAPYAALTGRRLAAMFAGQGIGLALNPDGDGASELLPTEAIAWLATALGAQPTAIGARPSKIAPPNAPLDLIQALDAKLVAAAGLARVAYLVAASYERDRLGHILAFIDAVPGAEPSLTQAVSEALVFSGLDAGVLDVAFFDATDPMAAKLASQGLRFDLPEPPKIAPVSAPGMDPDAPPKLR